MKFNSWRTRLFDKWESNVEGWMQEFVHLFDAPRRRLRDLLDTRRRRVRSGRHRGSSLRSSRSLPDDGSRPRRELLDAASSSDGEDADPLGSSLDPHSQDEDEDELDDDVSYYSCSEQLGAD